MQNKLPVLAIDARLYGNRSGAGRIATATVDEFVGRFHSDYSKIVLVTHSRKAHDALPKGDNVQSVLIDLNFLVSKLFLVPFRLKSLGVDAYFSPTSELPLWKFGKTKYVNMVHDLFLEDILDDSEGTGRGFFKALKFLLRTRKPLESFYLSGLFGKAFSIADATVAISNFSKSDAVRRYGLPESSFTVIPIAADERYFEDYEADEALRNKLESKFGIKGRYVFTYDAVGNFESFSRTASEACHSKGLSWVVLNRHESVYAAFCRAKTKDNVVFLRDFVSDEDLADLVRGSEFVFFPSPGEGFGIPIAECLACGKTVLVPGITAMPEVVGEYVTCYDPKNLKDLASKFEEVLDSYPAFENPKNDPFVQRYRWSAFAKTLNAFLLKSVFLRTDCSL